MPLRPPGLGSVAVGGVSYLLELSKPQGKARTPYIVWGGVVVGPAEEGGVVERVALGFN
jgi:hypothetical protein